MANYKYAAILSVVGSCADRFLVAGYSDSFSIEELFNRVASVNGISGVELVGDWHITKQNLLLIKENLTRTGLKVVSVIPNLFGRREWAKGAFSSKNKELRKKAVEETKELIDMAIELDCNIINLWLGQDGYDYIFQGDYIREREWIEECIKECCDFRKDMKISIEYKIREPRTHSYISSVAQALLMVKEVNEENCGVTIDFGHALEGYENPAESVALLKKYGDKLFHIHANDNYRYWDDDMMVGSVHTLEYIEFLYWLRKTEYSGWISVDQYPYREDGRKALQESIGWLLALEGVVNRIDDSKVEELYKSGDACEVNKYLRWVLLGR